MLRDGGDQPSIVSTALSYGARYGINEVLKEFAEQKQKPTKEELSIFEQLLRVGNHLRSINRSEPSFINYKTTDNEKHKIYKMIQDSPRKGTNRQKHFSHSVGSRQNKPKTKESIRQAKGMPKELSQLKEKLHMLPVLNRNKTEKDESNPEDDELETNLLSNFQAQRELALNSKTNLLGHKTRKSRKHYLQDLKTILNKSLLAI